MAANGPGSAGPMTGSGGHPVITVLASFLDMGVTGLPGSSGQARGQAAPGNDSGGCDGAGIMPASEGGPNAAVEAATPRLRRRVSRHADLPSGPLVPVQS